MGRVVDDPVAATLQRIKDARRDNLRTLAEMHGGTVKLAAILGYRTSSFLSQMIGRNPIRTISERVARSFETKLKLNHGWLDVPPGERRPE